MKILHSQIWGNLGVILRTCGSINNLNVVSLISNFCVAESATLSNPHFPDGFIISLCISLTERSINIFGKLPFDLIMVLKPWLHHLKHMMDWHWYEKLSIQQFLLSVVFYCVISLATSRCFQGNFFHQGYFWF